MWQIYMVFVNMCRPLCGVWHAGYYDTSLLYAIWLLCLKYISSIVLVDNLNESVVARVIMIPTLCWARKEGTPA